MNWEKFKAFIKAPAQMFVIKLLLIYGTWKCLFYFFTHGPQAVTAAWWHFNEAYGTFLADLVSPILNVIGQPTTHYDIYILFTGSTKWLGVAGHCLAIPAMVVFAATIIAFPHHWKKKLWFVPLGLLAIFLINLTRLVLLCLIYFHYPESVYYVYHTYVYVFATYGLIMLMIIAWVRITDEKKVPV
jgi:exosortase/archaeosortase family protein